MAEVKVREGEELNGLGVILKETMDKNLQDPRKYRAVEKLNASVVIRETSSGVAVTLHFRRGEIEIQNDAIEKPTAYQEAGFENLAYISSGQLSPTWALLTGKMRIRGNLLTLLRISKIMVRNR
ncbi:SCP2 sterol-binding domain-containing protein [Dehalococcoidia bacterium]|nr:SCP2 sterol-binding domain-containing protein [Dehalococcoidia bacterium]MCL0074149.1 SCP2 sterol-binding domain-containing protein [Dehalococcoidia bacterium]